MTMGEAATEFNSIMALIREDHRICEQYGITISFENPYSYNWTRSDEQMARGEAAGTATWCCAMNSCDSKNNERLRRAFAQKANVVGQHCI